MQFVSVLSRNTVPIWFIVQILPRYTTLSGTVVLQSATHSRQLDLAKLPARRSKIRPQMLIQSAGYVSQKSLDRLVCWMVVDMFSVLSAYETGERKVLKSVVVLVMYDGVLFAGVIAI